MCMDFDNMILPNPWRHRIKIIDYGQNVIGMVQSIIAHYMAYEQTQLLTQ